MKVRVFEKDETDAFFAAMNEMYECGKISRIGHDSEVDYIAIAEPAQRLGYFVPDDGYYLIVRE